MRTYRLPWPLGNKGASESSFYTMIYGSDTFQMLIFRAEGFTFSFLKNQNKKNVIIE